ncbi:MAG: ribosome silencing factor [Proteobacteria bacterium]|nr:MAG: ribosome silencing factor [Pseudomonadota bacterium]
MNAKELAEFCAQKCLEKKGENVVILDLENKSSVADYFVVCSGFSDRQVSAIADNVASEAHAAGNKPMGNEGMVEGRWALVDFGPVIVHVFQDHLRDFFNLEGLWRDAPRIHVREETSAAKTGSNHDSGSAHA